MVSEQGRQAEATVRELLLNRPDRYVDRGKREIDHDPDPEKYHGHIKLLGSLWAVTQGQDKAGQKRCQVKPFKDNAQNFPDRAQQVLRTKGRCQNVEN